MQSPASSPPATLASLGLTPEQALDVLAGEARLVILMMSAHMDWDWLLPFPLLVSGEPGSSSQSGVGQYFSANSNNAPAASILSQASALLATNPAYRYSVCEMGFLRAFAQTDPAAFAVFAASADRVDLSGAGITSPDNLLPHGEAFIRNYLIGRAWAASALPGATISQCYVPDDFGHDVELPVVLQAMGMQGVGFARIPGSGGRDPTEAAGGSTLQAEVLAAGRTIDFNWAADDGSTVLAHWMATWYGGATSQSFTSVSALQAYLTQPIANSTVNIIQASPTQYVYVPMAGDFQPPIAMVTQICAAWNAAPPSIEGTTTYCVSGTFDDFVSLVGAVGSLPTFGGEGAAPFYPTPYYAGAQASRPLLKILHARATRALLGAELLGAIASAYGAPVWSDPPAVESIPSSDALSNAWNLLAPSTHHDFITGTAHPWVYRSEQLPLLRASLSSAEWLREDAATGLAALLAAPITNKSVAVFNQIGAARTTLVECEPDAIGGATQITCGGVTGPVQRSAEGASLFMAALEPMGFATAHSPSGHGTPPPPADPVTVIPDPPTDPQEFALENDQVRVVLTAASAWGVASFHDKVAGTEVIRSGVAGNAIAIFNDSGTEYQFGCEISEGTFADSGVAQSVSAVEVLESGQLRGRVRVTTTCPPPGGSHPTLTYVREYALVSGEAMLRMQLAGAAPIADGGESTTVMVSFPLVSSIDTLVRGTPNHWSQQMPQLVWEGFTPCASHTYVVAVHGGQPLAGVLHGDVPAWGPIWSLKGGWHNDGTLYGAVLRNTNGSYYNGTYPPQPFPGGTDGGVHTRSYALLAPSACGDPAAGTPLLAGLGFATPPRVAELTQLATLRSPLPADYSAAAASPPALVTVVKLGTIDPEALIVRVYQPTNEALEGVTLRLDPRIVPGWSSGKGITGQVVTALEQPADGVVTIDGSVATFDMPVALATVALRITP
jgi:alpha-mannosidase